MPALGFHVSDGSTLDARVKARARETHDGKVSAYVRSAVERDLAGDTGSVMASDVITLLATKLLGERKAATLKPYLEGQDQPELLEAMLQRFFEETTAIKGRRASGGWQL